MDENGILIGEVKNGSIRVSVIEFSGKRYLDVRKYFADDAGEMKPTKKGIALNRAQFEEVLSMLAEKKGEILEKLG